MLLLPVILWWADSPFRFAIGRSRRIVCALSILLIAAMGTIDESGAIADDRSAYEPRGLGEALNEDAFSRRAVSDDHPSNGSVVREGTKIAPTAGRIVILGRRWAFLPAAGSSAGGNVAASDSPFPSRNRWSAKLISTPVHPESRLSDRTRFSSGGMFGPIKVVKTSIESFEARQPELHLANNPDPTPEPKRWILVENLMLQRIAEAVRLDPTDDQWILAGQMTEFFGENRMVIRTAQRSDVE